MKPTHEMNLAEVTLAILKAAVNIPDGLYVHAARLAKRELATYGVDGNLVNPALQKHPVEPDLKSDTNALEIFSKLMAHKLEKKSKEGRSGWQQCSQADLSRMLHEHVEKGDPVDVANFCMMLCANGFRIAAPHEDVRAVVDEPVAVVDESDEGLFIDFIYGEDGNPLQRGDKLYRHPQRPVVVPERRSYEESFTVHGQGQIMGWNACLNEISRLNK